MNTWEFVEIGVGQAYNYIKDVTIANSSKGGDAKLRAYSGQAMAAGLPKGL